MHRIHFSYWKHDGIWYYRFIDAGIIPLGAVRKTRKESDIRDIAHKGGGVMNSESRCMLDPGILNGQGGMYLHLKDDQYRKLKKEN